MKSKLLSGVAIPAFLALGTMTALAQDAPPPAAPAPAPAEKMAPAPTEEMAPAPTEKMDSSAAVDKTADATSQQAGEWRSSKLVGLNVYNANNEKIGDINDLIVGTDGNISSAVIGVGGFLGMGEKLVAVPFSELKFGRDANGDTLVTLDRSKDSLQSAPDFKYYTEKRS